MVDAFEPEVMTTAGIFDSMKSGWHATVAAGDHTIKHVDVRRSIAASVGRAVQRVGRHNGVSISVRPLTGDQSGTAYLASWKSASHGHTYNRGCTITVSRTADMLRRYGDRGYTISLAGYTSKKATVRSAEQRQYVKSDDIESTLVNLFSIVFMRVNQQYGEENIGITGNADPQYAYHGAYAGYHGYTAPAAPPRYPDGYRGQPPQQYQQWLPEAAQQAAAQRAAAQRAAQAGVPMAVPAAHGNSGAAAYGNSGATAYGNIGAAA